MQIDGIIRELFSEISFSREPAGLYDPLRYMIEGGGKRLRPRLCLTAYSLFKDEFDDSILQPAAGLEVFHTFTLIHDDIMDKSPCAGAILLSGPNGAKTARFSPAT